MRRGARVKCRNCNNKNCDVIDKLLFMLCKAGLKLFRVNFGECKDYEPKGAKE